jgi:hypothetical protein
MDDKDEIIANSASGIRGHYHQAVARWTLTD